MIRRHVHPALHLPCLAVCSAALAACTYQKDVNYKPFFTGLEGAEMQTPPSQDTSAERSSATPIAFEETTEDGEVILYTPTVGALIRNLARVLAFNESDLFEQYLLSEQTRQDAIDRGREIGEVWDLLKKNQTDIRVLFARLPMAERTPGALLEPIGDNAFKLTATQELSRGLRWKSMTAAVEDGQWKLIWFGD